MDLFGRYVHYLIVSDITQLLLLIIFTITGIIILKRGIKLEKENNYYEMTPKLMTIVGVILITIGAISAIFKIDDIIKDIYIPEIKIMQEIQSYTNPNK